MIAEIEIRRLRIACRLGVTVEERQSPQPLEVDIRFRYDVASAAAGDNIDEAVDYSAVARALSAWAADQEVKLVETLGLALADYLLAQWSRLESVAVTLRKFPLPKADSVEFRVERSRG